ncbi:MAG: DEAD/DEAH box helicase, partial [Rhodanobacteraceae bacterium]
MPMSLQAFHPVVAAWFAQSFDQPTTAQAQAWPHIRAGEHALVAAPTGSGKTLTAFLAAIDVLVREGLQRGGELPDETSVVYVSPLKALSNDIQVNLEMPLEGIRAELARRKLPDVDIRTMVRTGDTPQSARTAMRKRPPHILVTTPESLYVLLGSESGRATLATTRSVIVDEIHAVAGSKRGSHLALSLERLESLAQRRVQRIGLSATQKPIERVAEFLTGTTAPCTSTQDSSPEAQANSADARSRAGDAAPPSCAIVDVGYTRERDLALEVPPVQLTAVMSNDAWGLVYRRIVELVESHRTTLVFVNTRRMAERAARQLSEQLGRDAVAAHHGSLSKEHRLNAERRLKQGELHVLVATASLELGIDIGDVDLVCQLGSPRSIAALLQRVGRSGHAVGATPKGRLFPATLDDLVECTALLDSVRRDELDALVIPEQPLDVLAQQLVAELAAGEWSEDALYDLVRRAWPYRALSRTDFDAVVRMLAEGFSTQRGMRSAYLHRDAVNHRLRARRNARLTALTSGGTIPDTADYAVVLEPSAQVIGSVNEDFAIESMAGDIFQLGNQSYRILRVERDRLRVEDAQGLPPSIPFWIGEAPGRSDELSAAVSRLRRDVGEQLQAGGRDVASQYLQQQVLVSAPAAEQLVAYLADSLDSLGVLPTQQHLAMERFFDESGGMQLVIHSPFGSRINRAWGLALRKRFCRNFNFELQAAATEDAIVLSLSTAHSFPLEEVARYLNSNTAQQVLVQALLDAPLFTVRWRWAATTALALPRFQGGRKVPAPLQRMKSEDLLGSVFPDQVACLENIVGERQIPDHPLVAQTLDDCLHEAMDVEGLLALLRGLESGCIAMTTADLPAPSPLAGGVLNAAPYAFLDDAPLEERRTRAVQTRYAGGPAAASELGRLDADAIERVRSEAWPAPRDREEMHEALMTLGGITAAEADVHDNWSHWLAFLAKDHRATLLEISNDTSRHPPHDGDETRSLSNPRRPGAAEGGTRDPFCSSATPPEGEADATFDNGSRVPRCTRPQDDGADPYSAGPQSTQARPNQIWTAAERLPQWKALHPGCALQPRITAPAEYAAQPCSADDALRELLRARLGGLGPTGANTLAADLDVDPSRVNTALHSLQQEGNLMQGSFTPGGDGDEWCERHLLARIHRYTLGRLRREIEPVSRRDFMRFLFAWQHVGKEHALRGPDALANVLAQLEGFEAAAGAWESEMLPARVADYDPAWLDDLCRAGRLVWMRLRERA